MKFKHFLLTRFNQLDEKNDIYNTNENPQDWMRHRINLFERYTLPSIMKQTCKDFTWLLAFSRKTPQNVLDRYKNLRNIQIIYEYPKYFLQRTYKKEWLLTTRFDNDDILLPDFVEKVHKHVRNCENIGELRTEIIDVMGVQWDMINNKWYDSGRNMFNSPYLSLFENTKEPHLSIQPDFGMIEGVKTALYCSHSNMTRHFQASRIEQELYIMCIHDRNLANKVCGGDLKDATYFKTNYKI